MPIDDEDSTHLIILSAIWVIVSVLICVGLLAINAPVIIIVLAVLVLAFTIFYIHRRLSQ
ncbi:hypothetical protein ACFLVJ_02400 [Chloroflexota bacterium]